MLSFEEFQKTKKIAEWDAAKCQENGMDCDRMDVYEYDKGCFIEIAYDCFYIAIGNREYCGSELDFMERLLYNEWYVPGLHSPEERV